jgi:serine protease AprX
VIVIGRRLTRKLEGLSADATLGGSAVSGVVTAGALDALAAEPDVAYIAPDVPVAPLANQPPANGPARPVGFSGIESQFPFVDGATQAWARGYTGKGVGIAVIDSGIQDNGNFGSRTQISVGYNDGSDDFGHGSFVADIAAGASEEGRFVGIAPGATVVSYNVNSPRGPATSDVVRGLLWVLANRDRYNLRVVNLSLSETVQSSYRESILDSTVEALWRSGIVVVAAAGNRGPGSVDVAPANDPFAISVGAIDTNATISVADDALTPWSSRGATLEGFAKPELVAPGRRVVGSLPGDTVLGRQAPAANWVVPGKYALISGTSFSAPQVAGAAAVLFQQHPDWTADQVKWVLRATARPLAGSNAPALDLGAATAFAGTPGSANAGVEPSSFALESWVAQMLTAPAGWPHSTWKSNTWNTNTWNFGIWA